MHGGITIVEGGPLNITLPLIQSFTPSSVQMAKTAKPAKWRENIFARHSLALFFISQVLCISKSVLFAQEKSDI